MGNGERGTGNGEWRFVVKAATKRAFLYANYESNRWMNASHYPFVRDPHFKFRALDVSRSPEPLREWIAATGANAVYLKRGRPDQKRMRECAALDVPAYGFLYGCDAAKWNRERYDEFVASRPSAKGVTPPRSWEKGTLCPSDPATREFFAETIREIAAAGVAGVVVCLWDDYGLNCVCDRCKANGMTGNWGRQVAFAVKAWEDALKPLGKELIVRTWASGASHWLGDEWVHAPGYGGETGEPLSVWGAAMRAAGRGVRFQTKVYNADCQPDPPFSALLQVAPRREVAEWQITGQTVGLQYLPASVVDQTVRQFHRVAKLVSPEGGVMLYAGAYKRGDGYAALSDDLNSVNIHVWRQLSWNPGDDVEVLWREWAAPRHGENAEAVIAAMKSTERASVAAFSPLGLGAPTESYFANSAERRESLLRYTNRYFLPDGKAALAPTKENVARVIAEKDAAIARLDEALVGRSRRERRGGLGTGRPAIGERFEWLRSQLVVTRALDSALWRYFHLRECAKAGRLDADDELEFAGEASSGEGAAAFVVTAKPDVLLLDIRMPGRDGIETLESILTVKPSQKVVMLTTSDADDEVYRALNLGARGYLLKDRDSDAICKAVKTVHAGGKFIPEAVKEIYQRRQMMTDLTPREREVLELVAVGLPNDEVAKRLGISYESVKVHMKHLLFKFDVHDRTELVSLAIRGGFVKDVPAK